MIHAREDYMRIQDPEGKIGEDEPVILFRAKDQFMPLVIRRYITMLIKNDGSLEMIESLKDFLPKIEDWQKKNGCKIPDLQKKLKGDEV